MIAAGALLIGVVGVVRGLFVAAPLALYEIAAFFVSGSVGMALAHRRLQGRGVPGV